MAQLDMHCGDDVPHSSVAEHALDAVPSADPVPRLDPIGGGSWPRQGAVAVAAAVRERLSAALGHFVGARHRIDVRMQLGHAGSQVK